MNIVEFTIFTPIAILLWLLAIAAIRLTYEWLIGAYDEHD